MDAKNRSRKQIEEEMQAMRTQIEHLASKSEATRAILEDKAKSGDANESTFTILKYLINESKTTTTLLKNISDRLGYLEDSKDAEYEQDDQTLLQGNRLMRYQPLSELDAKIMQIIQIRGMACADDIMKEMTYKGRNAASARLNRLYKQGLLERWQLGHKVYYKFDAGKTTDTLIVSPPQ